MRLNERSLNRYATKNRVNGTRTGHLLDAFFVSRYNSFASAIRGRFLSSHLAAR